MEYKTIIQLVIVFLPFFIIGAALYLGMVRYSNLYRKDKVKLLVLLRQQAKSPSIWLPLILLSICISLYFILPGQYIFTHLIPIFLIINFAWLAVIFIYALENWLRIKFDITKINNVRERRVYTQILFIKRFTITFITIIAAAAILLTFAHVRKLGAGILTSAGIATIIVGFAAQKILATWLAGLQIALTQPIRIDDVVIVENEWGRIEEITLTYVVVRIWDQRRLVLPINYFIEKPFQNWTRRSSEIITSVFFFVDYMFDVEKLREQTMRLLKQTPLWNGQVASLQVVDTTEETMKLRLIMSANDSGGAWDLACYMREHLIQFIRLNFPNSLPRTRLELSHANSATNSAFSSK